MTKVKTIGLSLVVITALGFSGCGSSSSDSNNDTTNKSIKITGTISGNGYAKNDIINRFLNNIITPAYAVDLNSPDKIVVMYNNSASQKSLQ